MASIRARSRIGSRWRPLFATAGLMAAALAAAAERPPVAITGVSIVDVERGRLIGPRTVLIADGRIAAIDASSKVVIPEGAERIDGRGRFLIPGLADMHVHLFNNASHRPPNTWSFPLYIANGVTAVREMAGVPASIGTVDAWRRSVADGSLVAPHVVAAGVVAFGPSPEEAAHQVDLAADVRADFIKVFSEISEPAWRAVLEAAQRRSLPVMGHVPAGVSAVAAAQAGQRSEEHLMQVFEACSTLEQSALEERRGLAGAELVAKRDAAEARVLDAYDAPACDRAAAALKAAGEVQVPTLVLDHVESKPRDASPSSDPRWKYLRADERARWQRLAHDLAPDERAVGARRWAVARRIVAALHRANVPILAGTDAPMPGVYPGYALHEELELLVASGLSPTEGLQAATSAPAAFLGLSDEAGTVAVGKRADLVLLDADPLRDIRNTRRIEAVLLDGRLLRRGALDALLADAARVAGEP
jgi:imidazolonepropionase-like amidohydrolase